MDADLEAVKNAWDKSTGDGRDEARTRELADAYVEAHPDEFASLRELSLEDCVKAVDVFREAGMDTEVARIDVWLWHHFEPQNIGGTAAPTVRIPGA